MTGKALLRHLCDCDMGHCDIVFSTCGEVLSGKHVLWEVRTLRRLLLTQSSEGTSACQDTLSFCVSNRAESGKFLDNMLSLQGRPIVSHSGHELGAVRVSSPASIRYMNLAHCKLELV